MTNEASAARPKPKVGQTIILSTTAVRGPDGGVYHRVLHVFDGGLPSGFRARLFHQIPFEADAGMLRRCKQLPDGQWYERFVTAKHGKHWPTVPWDQAPKEDG